MGKAVRVDAFELSGLALASLSVLGAQVAMTRVLSLKYAANQTFLVVSFAVLGLAIGAGLAHWWTARRGGGGNPTSLGMLLFAATLCVLVLSFYLNLPALVQVVLVPLPFVGVGLAIATVFARRSGRAGFYYALDLAGAAAGAYTAAPLLDLVPAPSALVLFAAVGTGSALLFLGRPLRLVHHAPLTLLVLACLGSVASGGPGRWLGRVPVYPDQIKDMLVYLEFGRQTEADPQHRPFIEQSRWSAFGRTDVINDVARRQCKVLFVDGAAGSRMFVDRAQLSRDSLMELGERFGPALVLSQLPPHQKRSALCIGAGGGRDVLICRLNDVTHTTAVELNRDLVEIVRDDAAFNGNVYGDHPDITVVVAEGRHYLRTAERTYDLIMLSIPVTKRGEGYGGFALSESYLFTTESIREYLAHLNPEGLLLIVCHTRQEIGRLINTYLAGQRERGVAPVDAMRRVAVFGEYLITLVIAPQPRPEFFWQKLELATRRLGLAHPAERFYYIPREAPGRAASRWSPELWDVACGSAPAVTWKRQSTSTFEPDMMPVTDDRPFFYFFTASLPPLVAVVLLASSTGLLFMLLWGARRGSGAGQAAVAGAGEVVLWRLAVAGLGVAFMLAEIPLIQRFVFWFGRPTLALGLLLGTLLLATGVGSVLGGLFIRGRLLRTWPLPALLGVFLLAAFTPLQGVLFRHATGTGIDAFVRSLIITGPLGLLMGVPFPMLLTAAGRRAGVSVAWLWGVNGVGSVVGSAAAVAVAMLAGYSVALRLAGATYMVTAGLFLALAYVEHWRTLSASGRTAATSAMGADLRQHGAWPPPR
ncbi:MAG: hypothetical protein KKB50_22300 [Planctomycetes bacterium]|nr:hypothetical protein [Planctomycetota bacterium]